MRCVLWFRACQKFLGMQRIYIALSTIASPNRAMKDLACRMFSEISCKKIETYKGLRELKKTMCLNIRLPQKGARRRDHLGNLATLTGLKIQQRA